MRHALILAVGLLALGCVRDNQDFVEQNEPAPDGAVAADAGGQGGAGGTAGEGGAGGEGGVGGQGGAGGQGGMPIVCGDGVWQGAERCDDGNLDNLDGCDARCTNEVVEVISALTVLEGDGVAPGAYDRFDFVVDDDSVLRVTPAGPAGAACDPAVIGDALLGVFPLEPGPRDLERVEGYIGRNSPPLCAGVEGPMTAGAYTIMVSGVDGGPVEPYQLGFRLAVDLPIGETRQGAIAANGDDLYTVRLERDGRYLFQTGAEGTGCPGDTTLTLYPLDAQGLRGAPLVAEDGGGERCAVLTAVLPAGDYELVLSAGDLRSIPSYVLRTSELDEGVFRSLTFDVPGVPYGVAGFGGVEAALVADPTDPGNRVARITKGPQAEYWAGAVAFDRPAQTVGAVVIPAASPRLTMRVWSPVADTLVRLKLERGDDPGVWVETEARTRLVGGWQTLTFDFAQPAPETPAFDPGAGYDKIVVFMGFGEPGGPAATDYLFDDIQVVDP